MDENNELLYSNSFEIEKNKNIEYNNSIDFQNNKKIENNDSINFQNNLISDSITLTKNIKYSKIDDYQNFYLHSNKDVDIFLKVTYNYYIYGGYKGSISENIKNIILKIFMLLFSSFVLFMINWNNIITCNTKNTCGNFSNFFYDNLFKKDFRFIFTILYFSIYMVNLIFYLIHKYKEFKILKRINILFYDHLNISDTQLQGLKWNEVVELIVDVHNSKKFIIFPYDEPVNSYIINHSISKMNNYFISFVNRDLFSNIFLLDTYIQKDIEFYIKIMFLENAFTKNHKLNLTYICNYDSIKRWFVFFGIIHIFYIPFKIVYYIFNYLFHHAEDIKSQRENKDILQNDWTLYAKWQFREYNEMEHIFNKRLRASYQYADMYHKQYYKPVINSIFTCILFICKSVISILILVTLIDDNLLLVTNIFDKNLLWCIALLSVIISICKSGEIDNTIMIYSSEKIMKNIALYTHYYPDHWKNNCHKVYVKKEFNKLYKNKFLFFIYDLLSIAMIPYIFICSIPNSVEKICKFVNNSTDHLNGYGDICVYSNFEKKNNDSYHGNRHQKITQSFFNYQVNNPEWKVPEYSQQIIENIEEEERVEYKEKKLEDFFLKPSNEKS